MHIDLIGRVRNTKLPARHGLMPLFEAVINSIWAIREAKRSDGEITVRIERNPALLTEDAHGNTLALIHAFYVTDNGIGFDEENYRSFDTMDSRAKAIRGGKGVGRLLWLKAFEKVSVDSVYNEDGQWWHRHFDFVLTTKGVEHPKRERLNGKAPHAPQTEVRLIGFHNSYRDASPKSAEAIARRLIEHCLEYYFLGSMPKIVLEDPFGEEMIDLGDLFNAEFKAESQTRRYGAEGHEFTLIDVMVKSTADTEHALNLCAHNRVVERIALASRLPHLNRPLYQDGAPVVYCGYVSSPFLDQRVDAERTSFEIPRSDELAATPGELTWDHLLNTSIHAVSDFLGPRTAAIRQESLERIQKYIEARAPRYRPLLGHRMDSLGNIPGNLPDGKLDLELHRLLTTWQHAVRQQADKLSDIPTDLTGFEEYKASFVKVIGELQEVAKSDLAEYVMHRATVLSFFEKLLGEDRDGNFQREDALHSLFFPQRTDSNMVDFNEHNLWMLDERLAYHRYLSSDVRFSKQENSPVTVEGDDRPDILVYNIPAAFVPGTPFASVVIVEFKRPERSDYSDEENPITQVTRYIQQIRDGKAKRRDGSSVDPVPEGIPFYCHIVATLTPKLRSEALHFGYIEAPDRQGFFNYNQNFRAYIEISSYRKVLEDARKRNTAFFDRLQIRLD